MPGESRVLNAKAPPLLRYAPFSKPNRITLAIVTAAAAHHANAGSPLHSRYHSRPHAPLVMSETAFRCASTTALPPRLTAAVVSSTENV